MSVACWTGGDAFLILLSGRCIIGFRGVHNIVRIEICQRVCHRRALRTGKGEFIGVVRGGGIENRDRGQLLIVLELSRAAERKFERSGIPQNNYPPGRSDRNLFEHQPIL